MLVWKRIISGYCKEDTSSLLSFVVVVDNVAYCFALSDSSVVRRCYETVEIELASRYRVESHLSTLW